VHSSVQELGLLPQIVYAACCLVQPSAAAPSTRIRCSGAAGVLENMPRRQLQGALAGVANGVRVVAPVLGGVAVGMLLVLQLQELRQRRKRRRSPRSALAVRARSHPALYIPIEAVFAVSGQGQTWCVDSGLLRTSELLWVLVCCIVVLVDQRSKLWGAGCCSATT
jgi:hypothetical protein